MFTVVNVTREFSPRKKNKLLCCRFLMQYYVGPRRPLRLEEDRCFFYFYFLFYPNIETIIIARAFKGLDYSDTLARDTPSAFWNDRRSSHRRPNNILKTSNDPCRPRPDRLKRGTVIKLGYVNAWREEGFTPR